MSLLGFASIERGSALNRLDPRARILAAMAFAVGVVMIHHAAPLGVALLLALALMALARLPVGLTLKRMVMMDSFIIVMLLMLPFTVPGTALFTLWGWPASREGLQQATRIALQANSAVLALMALVSTQDPSTLGHALWRLGVPARLVHLLLFTVRYLDVIHQEYSRLRVAMKMRAFRPRNTLHTYRSFGYLIGMLMVRALERSERILKAMKCRGFTGQLPLLDELRFSGRDGVFLGLWLALLVALLLWNGWDWNGHAALF